MKSDDIKEAKEILDIMDNKTNVWGMIKTISHLMSKAGVTYDQFMLIFDLLQIYMKCEAKILSSDVDTEIDLDGDDGEWYEVPEIG